MNQNTTITLLLVVAIFGGGLSACNREGPAERAGKNVDNAVEKAGDKLEQSGDKMKR